MSMAGAGTSLQGMSARASVSRLKPEGLQVQILSNLKPYYVLGRDAFNHASKILHAFGGGGGGGGSRRKAPSTTRNALQPTFSCVSFKYG